MNHHDFTLVLNRIPSEDEYDLLFESGCDDASPETRNGTALVHFDRDAPSLTHALVTAIRDVERAGFRVQAVETDDLVSLRTIADRLGRSYEGMRLIATGQRGPGAFPVPLSGDGWSLYSWSQVVDWSTRHLDAREAVSTFEVEIAAANHIVRARNMLHEDTERAELARLLSA
ncbi:hypothetical protein DFQ14_11932 [Halopolyspora algeriensis]|uniref:AlpA family transcriptional regulator n=1 Tax=Halopolyspora algeriensis TaxID=1500506 RepID=A0A368VCH0_9ACTN|nr:hypothetical protein [Halopolyspora algeriensis]RCW38828.1 hypothetical protein DFQ14_11932 [Halopolyspora algeriensis]TQM46662.1 hypothetical protein FHU43_3780 [Halopolyspora algeriensis]